MSERPKIFIPGETGTLGRGANFGLKNKYELLAGTAKELDLSLDEGFRYFDFLNPDSLEQTIKNGNFDVILNLAGVANPNTASEQAKIAWQINCYGVLKMLDIISKMPIGHRPKVVLPMSVLQFDIQSSGTVDIDHPLKASGNEYINQKNTLFHEAKKFLKDVDIYFAFIANTTGYAHPEGYFGPDIMRQLVRGDSIIKHGDLDQKKPFLDSRNAGRILACAIKNMGNGGQLSIGDSFFIASGTNFHMIDFFKTMQRVAGRVDDSELDDQDDPRFGQKAKIKEIKFNTQMLTKMGFKEVGGMEYIAQSLYEEAIRVKNGLPLPPRGISKKLEVR